MVRRNGASAISDTCRFFPWPLRRADSCRNDTGAPSRSFRSDRTRDGMEISCRTFLGDERIDRTGRTRTRTPRESLIESRFEVPCVTIPKTSQKKSGIESSRFHELGVRNQRVDLCDDENYVADREPHLVQLAIRLFAQRSSRLNNSEMTNR